MPASDPANGSSAFRVSPQLPFFFLSSQGPVPFRSPFLLTFGPDPYNSFLILFNDSLIRPRCSPITSRSWLALRFSSLLLRRRPHMLSRSTCRCFFPQGCNIHSNVSSSPALGIRGAPQRSDTQRPTTAKPCGKVDIASNLDTSTAIPAAADGTVTMNVQNCASI
jgi:hypothetical protein